MLKRALSLAASVSLHGAVLGLVARWGAAPEGAPALPLAHGEEGVAIRFLPPRPRDPRREAPRVEGEVPVRREAPQPSAAREPSLTAAPVEAAAALPRPSPAPPPAPSLAHETEGNRFGLLAEARRAEEPIHRLFPLPPVEDPEPSGRAGERTDARIESGFRCAYPPACRRLRHEGTARVECEVDAAGRVTSVSLVGSSGCEEMDRAALDAFRDVRFRLASQGGAPAPLRLVQPVRFVLQSSGL